MSVITNTTNRTTVQKPAPAVSIIINYQITNANYQKPSAHHIVYDIRLKMIKLKRESDEAGTFLLIEIKQN